MLIESQANSDEIKLLMEQGQDKADEIEKLKLETTVVITEKFALQKELNRVDQLYNKMQKDFKAQRVQFGLMIDEISALNKQNSQYRDLILKNEENQNEIQQENMDSQAKIQSQSRTITALKNETKTLMGQVDKLIEELRDKSDSESFEDEKERLLNMDKALMADQLKKEIPLLKAEIETLKTNSDSNIAKLKNQLNFSLQSNKNLKNENDALQEKFDKYMKANNNTNEDLKEDIERLMQLNSRLEMQLDDQQ